MKTDRNAIYHFVNAVEVCRNMKWHENENKKFIPIYSLNYRTPEMNTITNGSFPSIENMQRINITTLFIVVHEPKFIASSLSFASSESTSLENRKLAGEIGLSSSLISI